MSASVSVIASKSWPLRGFHACYKSKVASTKKSRLWMAFLHWLAAFPRPLKGCHQCRLGQDSGWNQTNAWLLAIAVNWRVGRATSQLRCFRKGCEYRVWFSGSGLHPLWWGAKEAARHSKYVPSPSHHHTTKRTSSFRLPGQHGRPLLSTGSNGMSKILQNTMRPISKMSSGGRQGVV